MKYAIHDGAGRILRVVSCSAADAPLNAQEGEGFTEVADGVADDTHYIGEGGQAMAMSERPSAAHVFDFATLAWVDPRTETQRRDAVRKVFEAAIQKRLDTFARTRNYDNMLSACTYATSTVPKFSTEGQYCVEMRDATWAAAYALLAQVEAGQPVPTEEAVMSAMPALIWPS